MNERFRPDGSMLSKVNPGRVISYSYEARAHMIVFASGSWAQFYWDSDDASWCFVDLSSEVKGDGKAMVRELADMIGPGQDIHATVIEEATMQALLVNPRVKRDVLGRGKKISIKDRKVLSELKIIRVLEGGGLKTLRFEVAPAIDDETGLLLHINYFGST